MARQGAFLFSCLLVGCVSPPPPPQPVAWAPSQDEWEVMRQENRDLKERVETLAASVEGLRARAETSATPRVAKRKLTSSPPLAGASDEASEPKPAEPRSDGSTVADSQHVGMHHYFEGLRRLEAGEYDKAVRSLRRFLSESPEHVYADRAQFLLVEANLRNKEYGLALLESRDFEARYPRSFRLPDVLWQRATAYGELGQRDAAVSHLKRLVEQFPGEEPALNAAKRLAKLESEQSPAVAPREAEPAVPEGGSHSPAPEAPAPEAAGVTQ